MIRVGSRSSSYVTGKSFSNRREITGASPWQILAAEVLFSRLALVAKMFRNPPGGAFLKEQAAIALINELNETVARDGSAIEAYRLLMQQYVMIGWHDAAADSALQILEQDPYDMDAQALLLTRTSPPKSRPATPSPEPILIPQLPEDMDCSQQDLFEGYQNLRARAQLIQQEMYLLRDWQKQKGTLPSFAKSESVLAAMVDGRAAALKQRRPPGSARATASAMESTPKRALDIAITDLADNVRWLQSSELHSSPSDDASKKDVIREALIKRVKAMSAPLSQALQHIPLDALMHIEHEILKRTYTNTETMYGDEVSDILRSNFWVSEDNYAWDMEELAQAITSNGGIMRNPLTKQMFTAGDVRQITRHPMGKKLAALQVKQDELSQGIREGTIQQLESLAQVLLTDMTESQIPSRVAVDEFLAYAATLPQAEQTALDELRVPANDSHTGQAFDTSIGETVRDAQGNRICFHKTGDFIKQAAAYLRRNLPARRPAQPAIPNCTSQ